MHTLTRLAGLLAALTLAACGGGGDDATDPVDAGGGGGGGGGGGVTLSCDTSHYSAGAVALPSATDLAAYAATYNGEEGTYAMDGTFTKSGDATLVLNADGTASYKGAALTVTSVCLDNTVGIYGRILYVEAGMGHFDISTTDAGDGLRFAWGVAPDGATIFRNGVKP